jgi:hypothetical protein
MVTHIVFWNLKEEADGHSKEENFLRMKEALEALPGLISEIVALEVGKNENPAEAAWDVSLYSTFNTWDELQTYQAHPEHQKVVSLVGRIVSDRAVVDYQS